MMKFIANIKKRCRRKLSNDAGKCLWILSSARSRFYYYRISILAEDVFFLEGKRVKSFTSKC